ncbi:MAG: LemA family protein [Flavobacteriales bacterium]
MAYEKTGTGGFNIRKWILPLVLAVLALMGVSSYNGLVSLDTEANKAWADVEDAYERKYKLIPNLVATVKGYADFEQETIVAVTEARASAMRVIQNNTPGDVSGLEQADRQVGVAMGRFFGYTENYPNLKANENFLKLQDELTGSENRISVERKRYNESIESYESKRRSFPTVLMAGFLGFAERDPFKASTEALENDVEVKF